MSSSASNSKAKKTVNLKSSDGEIFEVDVSVIIGSQTIKHMIEDDCANEFIPLPNVDGKILAKVIEYCKKHHLHNDDDDDEAKNKKNIDKDDDSSSSSTVEKVEKEEIKKMKKWDEDFLKNVDQDALYDLILASNYLEVKDLLELCCQKVADMIKGKSPEEIRTTFNIKKDFTPEEEAEIQKENNWAFQ